MKYVISWRVGEYSDSQDYTWTFETDNIESFKSQLDEALQNSFKSYRSSHGMPVVIINGYEIDISRFYDYSESKMAEYIIHECDEWFKIMEFKKHNEQKS